MTTTYTQADLEAEMTVYAGLEARLAKRMPLAKRRELERELFASDDRASEIACGLTVQAYDAQQAAYANRSCGA